MTQPPAPVDDRHAGLCARCEHVHRVENDRGSTFYRCRHADVNPSYRKYPILPVLRCAAFTPGV